MNNLVLQHSACCTSSLDSRTGFWRIGDESDDETDEFQLPDPLDDSKRAQDEAIRRFKNLESFQDLRAVAKQIGKFGVCPRRRDVKTTFGVFPSA